MSSTWPWGGLGRGHIGMLMNDSYKGGGWGILVGLHMKEVLKASCLLSRGIS